MGLAERRAVKAYQDSEFPTHEAAIRQAAGFDVPIEVDWASLGVDGWSHMYTEAFTKVFFLPLAEGLGRVACDDMGKEALREGLSRIEIGNHSGIYGESSISFSQGVLKIDHEPFTNIDDVGLRADSIVKALESGL